MLNELYSLSNTISGMGVTPENWHREFLLLPKASKKAPCFRIWISKSGTICGIEELDLELVQRLRKYGNNQRSFPAFNIKPLYRITDEQQKKELEQFEKDNTSFDSIKVKSWCIQDNWHKNLKSIDKALGDTTTEISGMIKEQGIGEQNVISQLIFAIGKMDGGLRKSLERYLYEKLEKKEGIGILLRMLLYSGNLNKNPTDDVGNNISIILDLFEWREYGYPVASEPTRDLLNSILLKHERQNGIVKSPSNNRVDAFSDPYDDIQEPMPKVKLQGFDVSLRAMFHEQLCQFRYGTIDGGSYPIAKSNRANVKSSLEWIAEPGKEGKTWKKADDKEIVFIFPSKIPSIQLNFASLFGEPIDRDGKVLEQSFTGIAQEFIKTLRGLPTEQKPDNIQVFSIRKMDKARSKIVFTRSCTPNRLVQSAEEWQLGCENIPEIESVKMMAPFPLQVPDVLNDIWKQDGELANRGKTTVKRMQYYQGLELLIDPLKENEINYYLHILLSNSAGLVKYFGHKEHGKFVSLNKERKLKRENNIDISRLLAVFGLLLYKDGHKKENYMNDTAYQVGQILKISDELHALYCKVVRDDEVPPQLAGNSVFISASETPVQALAQLCRRMNPYIAWAKQYRTKNIVYIENDTGATKNRGKESWRASWYLNLYEDVANKLEKTLTESTHFNDFEKAQMFIGYLAAFPKRERPALGDANMADETSAKEFD